MFLTAGPAVAHAATDASIEDASDAGDDADDEADADDVGDGIPAVLPSEGLALPKPAMLALFASAVATIVLGVLPVGSGVLEAAAEALTLLK